MIFAQTLRPRLLPLLLMGVVCLSAVSCQMPTDRGRVNPTDYKSDSFVVNKSGQLTVVLAGQQVQISWGQFSPSDKNGYLLDYRNFETEDYMPIATLSRGINTYFFSSNMVMKGTEFRVRSFVVHKGDSIITQERTAKFSPGASSIRSMSSIRPDQGDIYIQTDVIAFATHVKLVADFALDSQGNKEILSQRGPDGRFTFVDSFVEIPPLVRNYSLYSYVEYKGELHLQDSDQLIVNISNFDFISKLSVDILSESRTRLRWEALNIDYEGFRIYLLDEDNQAQFLAQVGSNVREFIIDEPDIDHSSHSNQIYVNSDRSIYRGFRIYALFRNTSGETGISKISSKSSSLYYVFPTVHWLSIQHLDEERVRLTISMTAGKINMLERLELHLMEEVENNVFELVSKFNLPRSINFIFDLELEPYKTYQARIFSKTRLLGKSNTISMLSHMEMDYFQTVIGKVSNFKVASNQASFVFSSENNTSSTTSSIRVIDSSGITLTNRNISRVKDMAISSDATKLVYLNANTNRLHQVDYPSFNDDSQIFTFPADLPHIASIALSMDNRQIYATNSYGSLFMYDMDSEAFSIIDDVGTNGPVFVNRKIQISADGRFVYYANSHLKSYDTETGQIQVFNGLPQGISVNQFVRLNEQGDYIISTQSQGTNSIELYKWEISAHSISKISLPFIPQSVTSRPGFPNSVWVHAGKYIYSLDGQTGNYKPELYLSGLSSLLGGMRFNRILVMNFSRIELLRIPTTRKWNFIEGI